jgi:TRAP-type uncharacterized transport system substrate-binding protein
MRFNSFSRTAVLKSLGKFALLWSALLLAAPAHAQSGAKGQDAKVPSQQDYREMINANTVTVLGASISGAYIKIVDDIAKAVNDGNNLRVLPVVGEGGSQNIRDILYLKNVDVGIVMSTSLDAYKGQPLFENLPQRLQYIARLYEEEFHIVGGGALQNVHDLNGKKVGFHGGAFVSGQELLAKLAVKPAEVVKVDFFDGLQQIKAGQLDAIIRATASPMKDLDDKLDPAVHKFIAIPLEDALIESHLPAKLLHKHYPKSIPEGQSVETVAIGVILAAYSWPANSDRYRRVAKFTDALFSNIGKLLADKERHPKWDDVNLAARLPGWKRFPAAEEWLQKHGQTLPGVAQTEEFQGPATAQDIQKLDPKGREKLFRDFEQWRSKEAVKR